MTRSAERLRVHYRLNLDGGADARDLARSIALEQTVELPEDCLSPSIEQSVVGAIESVERSGPGVATAVISYDTATIGDDLLQAVNLLFGNVSLQSGVRIERVDWPDELLSLLPGPRLGIGGLRRLCGDNNNGRPLLCAALKPIGLSAEALAERCRQFALGGIDIIKDDHSLADQPTAPFKERVERCQEAVEQANRESGGSSVYFPNLVGGALKAVGQLESVRSAGCRGVLVAPLLAGLDTVRWLARDGELAILAHPSLAGAFFHERHGVAPAVLLGQLFRISGADAVIYPNVGGRFPFSAETCAAINASLREPLGGLLPAFPVPAGGIDAERVGQWVERYGPDTIFLIGGSLYRQPDLVDASRQLVETVRRHSR